MRAVNLKTDFLVNPIGIDKRNPVFSWNCEDGIRQSAYEIKAVSKGETIWDSGKVLSNRMRVQFEEKLESRQKVYWKVRLWDENGQPGEWSQAAMFEMGLLNKEDFCASWIDPDEQYDSLVVKPASYLRRSFTVEKLGDARLYITCHGLYETHINGRRVGDFVLAPGYFDYDKRSVYQTYDVTTFLRKGENQVEVILGDGWYRGTSVVDGRRNLFGEKLALYFQLEVEGLPVCLSDEKWEASQHGPILENDLQLGEVVDARLEKVDNYHPVKLLAKSEDNFCCSNSVPVCEMERFPGQVRRIPNGGRIIDFGQNISGYLEFELEATSGQTIVLIQGEELDSEGNFTQENFLDREDGRTQRLTYICKEGLNHYKTKFSLWGFRYAKIETDIDISNARFTAIAVYSRMEETSSFESSDSNLNKLFENCMWSQKSCFCDVPVNRTTGKKSATVGDLAIYINTGLLLMDSYTVIRKTVEEWRKGQATDGNICNIMPRSAFPEGITGTMQGSPKWGDGCIIVPYYMYRLYEDPDILSDNYNMMTAWYDYLLTNSRKRTMTLKRKHKCALYTRYMQDRNLEYCQLTSISDKDIRRVEREHERLTTAYLSFSGNLLADIAKRLDKNEDSKKYQALADKWKKEYRKQVIEDGTICSTNQDEYVRALEFNLLSKSESKQVAKDLDELIRDNGIRTNTGFWTRGEICRVLADNGYVDTAYSLLLEDQNPGWMYSVRRGATTIWEDWKGTDENGRIKGSHNHYASGAVCGWLINGICGIMVKGGQIEIRPKPNKRLSYASASYNSILGRIESSWRYENGKLHYEITTPPNVVAKIILPTGEETKVYGGKVKLVGEEY